MNTENKYLDKKYSDLNHRLSELMKSKNITIQMLAKKAGVAVGTIQKVLTDPSCNPTISSIESICNVFGVSISELIGQEDRISMLNGSKVYLLDWSELPITLLNIHQITDHKRQTIKTSASVGKNAFALKMHDDSMLPLFPESSILIFDSDKTAKNNSYVLVYMHEYQNIMFKQLIIDEPFKFITAINPVLKDNVVKLEQQDKIIAVLVQAQMCF